MPTKEEVLAIMQKAAGKKVVPANAEISAETSGGAPSSGDIFSFLLEEAKKTNVLLNELRRILIGEGV